MNTTVLTLAALIFSLIGLAYLAHTNAKRRRAHKLSKYTKATHVRLAWVWVFLPLPVLIFGGNMPALIMWVAAISLLGWGVAVKKPMAAKSAH